MWGKGEDVLGRNRPKTDRIGPREGFWLTNDEALCYIRSNRLEALKGDRKGQFSIRINDQYRICFRWQNENAADVEIVDCH